MAAVSRTRPRCGRFDTSDHWDGRTGSEEHRGRYHAADGQRGVNDGSREFALEAGGTVPIAVTFSETVNVSGTPQLTLNDGAVVNYGSGSGTSTLTFNYTVAAGQNTADLDYASTAALNGGIIQDTAGNAAVLTLPATETDALATKNIVIDTTTLTVTAADWTSAGLTLTLGSDGNLHVYTTGTTTDAVPPCPPASVTNIEITAPSDTGCQPDHRLHQRRPDPGWRPEL